MSCHGACSATCNLLLQRLLHGATELSDTAFSKMQEIA